MAERKITNENRAFKGIWIPAKYWLDENLTIIEVNFLAEIESLDLERGCFASNNYFADFFGLSAGRCSQIIKSLNEKGYITLDYIRNGKQIVNRVIKVVNKLNGGIKYSKEGSKNTKLGIKNSKGGIKNIARGYLENCKENNTNNNTVNNTNNKTVEVEQAAAATTEEQTGNLTEVLNEEANAQIEALADVESCYQVNLRPRSGIPYQIKSELTTYVEQIGPSMVKHAIEKSVVQVSNPSWGYIKAILDGWLKTNVKTIEAAKKADDEYQQRKAQQQQNRFKNGRLVVQKESLPDWAQPDYQEKDTPDDPAKSKQIAEMMAKINARRKAQ